MGFMRRKMLWRVRIALCMEFRPMSVINATIKLITELMANRLQPFLQMLVGFASSYNTAIYGTIDLQELHLNATNLSPFLRAIPKLNPFFASSVQPDNTLSVPHCWRWTNDGTFTTSSAYWTPHHSSVCC